MSILEIIQLHSAEDCFTALRDEILESIADAGCSTGEAEVYRRPELVSDFAVHIRRHDVTGEDGPSELGLCIASVLEVFGRVEHNLWSGVPEDTHDHD